MFGCPAHAGTFSQVMIRIQALKGFEDGSDEFTVVIPFFGLKAVSGSLLLDFCI